MGRHERPIVVSEWGYSFSARDGERLQADSLTRAYKATQKWGVGLTVWYEWTDSIGPDGAAEHFGLTRRDGSEKPALRAFREVPGSRFQESRITPEASTGSLGGSSK